MGTEVLIIGAKRNAVLGVKQRPITWKSVVTRFDKNLTDAETGLSLDKWLEAHSEWEVKQLVADGAGGWILVGQRPLA